MPPAAARPADQRGFALLLVLSIAAALALIGTQLAAAGRTEALIARNLLNRAIAEQAADGAVRAAIFALAGPPDPSWPTDGQMLRRIVAGIPVTLKIDSKDGRLDPNRATPAELASVLTKAGVDGVAAPGLAFAITGYRQSAPPGKPAFAKMEDLMQVPGMTDALAQRLRPLLAIGAAQSGAGQQRLTITATALPPSGGSTSRRAMVTVTPGDPRHPYRILAWDSVTL